MASSPIHSTRSHGIRQTVCFPNGNQADTPVSQGTISAVMTQPSHPQRNSRRTEASATAQVDDFHGAQLVTCHGLHRVSPPLSQCMRNGEKTCRVTGDVFCQDLRRVPPNRRTETRANARNARNNPPPQSGKTRLQYRRNPDPSVTASAPTHRSRKASRKQNPLRVRRASIGSVTYNAS